MFREDADESTAAQPIIAADACYAVAAEPHTLDVAQKGYYGLPMVEFMLKLIVFREKLKIPNGSNTELNVQVLSSLAPRNGNVNCVFSQVSENVFYFREEKENIVSVGSRFTPVMEGELLVHLEVNEVEIVGKLKWFTLLCTLVLVFIVALNVSFVFSLAFAFVYIFIYMSQKKRFKSLGRSVIKKMATRTV
ncbi:hypothetical protein QU481_23540 [Crenobacter sp. SG2303]|uniref:Uncharacterized protein n=1 Tax=Crenobacter oryzisoli TaxID=3056844 RepID=A0ABT7XVF3_9NEIS|nr:hypothetical protein [Crenobacter sp. SG2303]MDN0077775.1 hypothetical protein [Crenobacter sp. SG2303]